jgi:predicted secreted Zn-dependent protease
MKRFLLAILTLGLVSVACGLSPSTSTEAAPGETIYAQVSNAAMVYYEVSGSTAAELRTQLNQQSPVDWLDGLHYDARTDWYVSWTWPGYGSNDCDLSMATVDYEITVTLPHWKPAADVDPKLIEQWNRYLQNLAMHEQGHVDPIVKNNSRVLEAIQGATCATADQAAQDVLNTFRLADIEYDEQTRHGETQGAKFP